MFSVLIPGASGPGSSPGRDTVLWSWARHSTLTVPFSRSIPANCRENLTNCGELTCDGLASRPGGVEILPAASCYRNRDKLRQLWASHLFFLLSSRVHGLGQFLEAKVITCYPGFFISASEVKLVFSAT